MYTLLGSRRCEQNLHVAGHLASAPEARDDLELKNGYLKFLNGLQAPMALARTVAPTFVDDPDTELALIEAFVEPRVANDVLDPITPEVLAQAMAHRDPRAVAARRASIEAGRALLEATAPGWARLVDLSIRCFYTLDIPRNLGGSSGRAIGAVWVNTAPATSAADMAEFLVHETTHHVAFLDDRLWRHYTPMAHEPEAVAMSAIRGVPRPVPAVFDSVLVALEVLALRASWTMEPAHPALHPSSPALLESTQEAIASIRATTGWMSYFAPAGRMLFEAAEERLTFFAHTIEV